MNEWNEWILNYTVAQSADPDTDGGRWIVEFSIFYDISMFVFIPLFSDFVVV